MKYKTPKKYINYPEYIIGDEDIKKHVYNIWKHLQNANGIRLRTQGPRMSLTNIIIAGFYRLGLEEKKDGCGELETTNKKTKDRIIVREITLELVPKLRV